MAGLATVDDYEARYGAVPDALRGRVQETLDDASALVLDAVEGSTAAWTTGAEAPPRQVVMVCCGAVHRAMKGTEGVVREQLGEYATTYRADEPWSIWLTREERRSVRKAAGLSSARTVTLVSPFPWRRRHGEDFGCL